MLTRWYDSGLGRVLKWSTTWTQAGRYSPSRILYSSRKLQKRSQTPLELRISSFAEFITFASGKTKPLFTDSGKKNMLKWKSRRHFHFDFHRTLKVLKEPSVKNCSFNKCEYQHLNQRRRLSDSEKHWVLFINPISPPSSLFPKPSHFIFSSLSSGRLIIPLLLHTSCHHVAFGVFFYPNTPASAFSSSLSSLPLRLLSYQTRLLPRGHPFFFLMLLLMLLFLHGVQWTQGT